MGIGKNRLFWPKPDTLPLLFTPYKVSLKKAKMYILKSKYSALLNHTAQ